MRVGLNIRVGALPTSKTDIKHFFCIHADRRSRGVSSKLCVCVCVYAADTMAIAKFHRRRCHRTVGFAHHRMGLASSPANGVV